MEKMQTGKLEEEIKQLKKELENRLKNRRQFGLFDESEKLQKHDHYIRKKRKFVLQPPVKNLYQSQRHKFKLNFFASITIKGICRIGTYLKFNKKDLGMQLRHDLFRIHPVLRKWHKVWFNKFEFAQLRKEFYFQIHFVGRIQKPYYIYT